MSSRKRTDQERVVEYFTAADPIEAALILKTVQAILRARGLAAPVAKRTRKLKVALDASSPDMRG